MDWSSLWEHVLSGLVVALLAALLATFITSRIVDGRARDKALRDNDQETARHLYRLAGMLFEAWKLWDFHSRSPKAPYDDEQWSDMIGRAAKAEGECESLVMRIALEHNLEPQRVEALWCLRNSFKQLRYSIREREPLLWWASDIHPDDGYRYYKAYKAVLSEVGLSLSESDPPKQRWRRWFRLPASPEEPSGRRQALETITNHATPALVTNEERANLVKSSGHKVKEPQQYDWVLVAERFVSDT